MINSHGSSAARTQWSNVRRGAALSLAASASLALWPALHGCTSVQSQRDLAEKSTTAQISSGLAATSRPLADFVGVASGTFHGDVGASSQSDQIDLLRRITQMGIHRVRVDFSWDVIEPKRGQWNWGGYDSFVRNANSWNVEILGILDYGTTWANPLAYAPKGDVYGPPDRFADFTSFAVAVATHYLGSVRAYEIWNEPNNGGGFWHEATNAGTGQVDHGPRSTSTKVWGDPGLFAHLVAETINAVRAKLAFQAPLLAPGGTIFLAEPLAGNPLTGEFRGNNSGPDFMKAAFQAEPTLAALTDAVTLHGYDSYPPRSPPESNADQDFTTNVHLSEKISQMNTTFVNAGTPSGKPVWLTEIGWPNKNDVDEGKQARWLVRSVLLGALSGADLLYLYNMYDKQQNDGFACGLLCPNTVKPEDWFGLVRFDGSPKQSYLALTHLMSTLGSYHVTGRDTQSVGPTQTVYVVQLADGLGNQAWVVWDSTEAGSKYQWPVPPNTNCTNILGGSCAITNGMLSVNSTPVLFTVAPGKPPMADEKLVACNASGDLMDTQGGIRAYCDDLGETGKFQCDQYANRFMSSLNLPPVDNWKNNLACEICDLIVADPRLSAVYSVWGPGYTPTAGNHPMANDLLVWAETVHADGVTSMGCDELSPGAPGHVAVVTAASNQSVQYIQQNWMVSGSVSGSAYAGLVRASTSWDRGAGFFGSPSQPDGSPDTLFQPKCWVHPKCPPGTRCNPGIGANPCAHVGSVDNGLYCGTSPQAHFNESPAHADPSVLYECFDSQVADEFHCPRGCYVAGNGVPDGCTGDDPCAGIPAGGNGTYCGRSIQQGFNHSKTANPAWLYTCLGGHQVPDALSNCGDTGCSFNPTGADFCTPHPTTDPCARVSGADNGFYCGTSPSPVFDGSKAFQGYLYNCRDGRTVQLSACGAGGCTWNPKGPDHCDTASDPCQGVPWSQNGTFCAGSQQFHFQPKLAYPGWLYTCRDGHTINNDFCVKGCMEETIGPDLCLP
ncbi:MAG: endo-1,4-beta-xylanase [Myxococcota bacterium]|nr:endo-1,4-beta-xylanase [Myxococcota bacterium]